MWQEKVLKNFISKMIEADRESSKIVAILMDLDIHVENKAFFSIYNILREIIGLECLVPNIESYENGDITLEQLENILYEHIEKKYS
ncbi:MULTISPECIES: hypothetical protein [Bacillus cereus group]|uniref:Uncharacterized protein n=1 Tax=Bacillus thuringiensis TaxID=1428 RepID=A0AB33B6C1_BACTU|nr:MULTISPECIES: hypothetical protein [Bacillus cereus group]HDR7534304.1 hypothetical protein [Bacillus anthracis]AJG79596.1 hypothetical protein BF38_5620 [Bacillus thuringiensis]EEK53075.1 hypothetical protein bcere0004_56050 [Bacillus cereus BGSC 6E1]EEM74079.1 hypothetical protein bthur0010_59180 [Bacillus thuringiensis serovar pondicheriensis BGSC 4BA1]KAA0749949.1 hypothetical protein DN397_16165 [Bacillus sp. AY1-10]